MKEVGDQDPFEVPGGATPEGDICRECEEPRVHDGICQNCGHRERRLRMTELNSLVGHGPLQITRQIVNGRDTLFFHPFAGEDQVFFQCCPDDLFDCEGNRLDNDLPIWDGKTYELVYRTAGIGGEWIVGRGVMIEARDGNAVLLEKVKTELERHHAPGTEYLIRRKES